MKQRIMLLAVIMAVAKAMSASPAFAQLHAVQGPVCGVGNTLDVIGLLNPALGVVGC